MHKYNRKFTTRLKRFERWYNVLSKLSEFEGLINSYDGASPDEVKTMKEIHKKLYECSVLAHQHLEQTKIKERKLR